MLDITKIHLLALLIYTAASTSKKMIKRIFSFHEFVVMKHVFLMRIQYATLNLRPIAEDVSAFGQQRKFP